MKGWKVLIVMAAAALAAAWTVSGPAEAAPAKKKMTIGTASIGGVFYPVGSGIANLINKYVPGVEVRVEVTGGAVENPRLVGSGETDLGITNTDIGYYAHTGAKPYPKALPIRAIALMYPSTFHMATREDLKHRTLQDLKGLRVAVGPAGGSGPIILQRLMPLLGMDYKRDLKPSYISYSDGAQALQDGNVDAVFTLAGAPTASILELTVRTSVRFLKVEEDILKKFIEKYPYYLRVVIPKDYYKTKEDGVSIGVGNLLIVNEKMDENLTYRITAALFDHIDEFRNLHAATKVVDLKLAPQTAVPLHPGAARYYREKGVLK